MATRRVLAPVIFIPAEPVTQKYIWYIKNKYHLSWEDMDERMRYKKKSRMAAHAYLYPEGHVSSITGKVRRYLTPQFAEKFTDMVGRIEKEKGHVHVVILKNGVKRIPKEIVFAGPGKRCKGCRKVVVELPASGYCDEYCHALYLKRRRKQVDHAA
jgi:hypothetical protein